MTSKIAVGDTIHVEYKVVSGARDGVLSCNRMGWDSVKGALTPYGRLEYIHEDNPVIVKHIPAPPKPPSVGDLVEHTCLSLTGTLLGIHGDRGWVKWEEQSVPQSPLMEHLKRRGE